MTDHPFSHCPSCGGAGLAFDGRNRFRCGHCGFSFFHNTAAACGAILTVGAAEPAAPTSDELPVLFLVRGTAPARGMLDFPGGFIDPGESVEAALAREIREEIDAEATSLQYFWSAPNTYRYRGVDYNTCDLVFTGHLAEPPRRLQRSEIDGYRLIAPSVVDLAVIAFPSLREAFRRYAAVVRDSSRR